MLDYIIKDFQDFRIRMNDNSVGSMIISDSYEQAEMMSKIFKEKYHSKGEENL